MFKKSDWWVIKNDLLSQIDWFNLIDDYIKKYHKYIYKKYI